MIFLGVFFMLSPLLSLAAIGTWIRRSNRNTLRLWSEGIPGRALVISAEETGRSINNAPEIELELEVMVNGSEPYRTRIRDFVGILELVRTQPGQTVQVRVDPHDPENVVIASGGSSGGKSPEPNTT